MDQNFNNDQNNFNNQPINNQNFNQGISVNPQQQPASEHPVNNNYSINSNNQEPKKSKFGLIIVVLLIVVAIVIACVFLLGQGDKKDNNYNNTTKNGTTEIDSNTENQEANKINLSYTHKVPGKSIYVDVPSWDPMELTRKMTSTVYKIQGTKYVSVTCIKDTANSVDEAHNLSFDAFKENMYRYHPINSTSFTSKTNKKINGIDVYRFEGTMNCRKPDDVSSNYDAYIIGYSFIINDTPCSIIGSVQETSQQKSNVDEIKSTIEEMIKTVRTER